MKCLIVALLTVLSLPAFSQIDRKGNGGDMCEDRFKTVRDDLVSWIQKGGPANLNLVGTTLSSYSQSMLAQMASAAVSCTSDQVFVSGQEKTCKNFIDASGRANIVCNLNRFMGTDESSQYILVHHEYAGLAGVEVNNEDGSVYTISNQISGFLENQTVKKLAIKPVASTNASAMTEKFLDASCFHYQNDPVDVTSMEYVNVASRLAGKVMSVADVNGIVGFQFRMPQPALAALYFVFGSSQSSLVQIKKHYVPEVSSNVYNVYLSWSVQNEYGSSYGMTACFPIVESLFLGGSGLMYVWPQDGSATYLRSFVLQ